MTQCRARVVVWAMLAASPSAASAPGAAASPDGVRLRGRWFEDAVRLAVRDASRRLDEPGCSTVLDLRDRSGRALRARLQETGLDAPSYVRQVLFYDGSNDSPCRQPRTLAFTAAGSRVVSVCSALGRLAASSPGEAQAVVIHEVLHTLGLGENPPASDEITALVERRCRPR